MISINENFNSVDPRCGDNLNIYKGEAYIKLMLFSLILILIVPFFMQKN